MAALKDVPNFDRSGWIEGLKLIPTFEKKVENVMNPPLNLNDEQGVEWGRILLSLFQEFVKLAKTEEAEQCLQAMKEQYP